MACAVTHGMTTESDGGPGGVHALMVNQQPEEIALHISEQAARAALARYAAERWHHIAGHDPARQEGLPDTPDVLGDDEVISIYFRHSPGESWNITRCRLGSPAG